MIRIRESMSIVEMRIGTSQFSCCSVHEFNKSFNGPGYCLRNHICSIVSGEKHGSIKDIDKRKLFTGDQFHGGRPFRNIHSAFGNGYGLVQVLNLPESKIAGHDFCGGGRIADFVSAFFKYGVICT